ENVNRLLGEVARSHSDVCVLDVDRVAGVLGRAHFLDERKWLTMRLPYSAEGLLALSREWLRLLGPIAGRTAKCVAVGLVNALWGGIVGEDGPSGLELSVEYPGAAYLALQRTLLDLRDRGLLLAIASKNNPEDAAEVLERHPEMLLRPEHFSAVRIGWQAKS